MHASHCRIALDFERDIFKMQDFDWRRWGWPRNDFSATGIFCQSRDGKTPFLQITMDNARQTWPDIRQSSTISTVIFSKGNSFSQLHPDKELHWARSSRRHSISKNKTATFLWRKHRKALLGEIIPGTETSDRLHVFCIDSLTKDHITFLPDVLCREGNDIGVQRFATWG
jgi:hypothetical protein